MRNIFVLLMIFITAIMVGCGGSPQSKIEQYAQSVNNGSSENSDADSDSGGDESTSNATQKSDVNGDLTIKMLNVGQGDAILIQTKTQNILIDASDTDERDKLIAELNKANIRKIDKLILTHPHADHIGGAKTVLEKYEVGEVYDNGCDRGKFAVYKGYINAAQKKNVPVKHLKAGDKLNFGNRVSFEVFYPTEELRQKFEDANDYNNTSLVGKLTYGDFSMLFTGDAEKATENEILNSKYKKKLKSTILKAPHHGSKSSTGADYMKLVSPEVVLISAGDPSDPTGSGNSYGHPHKAALESYIKSGGVDKNNIYWTYENGTITIITDGKNYSVQPEKNPNWITKWLKKNK